MKELNIEFLGFQYVQAGACAYIKRKENKFFLKAGRKFTLELFGLELTNKDFVK